MPSPVGHGLVAVTIAYQYHPEKKWWLKWNHVLGVFIASALPDFDLIPGLIIGNLNRYHHGITHTLFFLVVVTSIYMGISFVYSKSNNWLSNMVSGSMLLLILTSHVILDGLCVDSRSPFGMKFFSPFSSKPVDFHFELLGSFQKDYISQFIHPHNFLTVIREIYVLFPLCFIAFIIRRCIKNRLESRICL